METCVGSFCGAKTQRIAKMSKMNDNVVETAGYYNLAGFNDDTRAFLSLPARQELWRRGVALHLGDQIDRGILTRNEAEGVAKWLVHDAAVGSYRLKKV
jgi:glucuronate isomerase